MREGGGEERRRRREGGGSGGKKGGKERIGGESKEGRGRKKLREGMVKVCEEERESRKR